MALGGGDSSRTVLLNRVGSMVRSAGSLATTVEPALRPTRRQRAEPVVRRLLALPGAGTCPVPTGVADASAHRLFNFSMALSGLRCILGYVVLPIVTPAIGAAARVGPVVGVPIAVVALVFDVMTVRRFWAADHPWRWRVTAIYAVVMVMVLALLIGDVVHLAS
jgi:hypothetical protein